MWDTIARLLSDLLGRTNSNVTDDYMIANEDSSGTIAYYGFVKPSGNWYIMKQDTINGTYRYAANTSYSDFTLAWANRNTTLTYDLPNNVNFK